MNKKKILAISGSTKADSTNEAVLKLMQGIAGEQCNFTFYSMASLPFFNIDLEQANTPEEVLDFRSQIALSDAVIICSPEYIFSLPGVLKNALEWTVSSASFSGKPVALIIASGLGEKAYESLQVIMRTIEAKFDERATLLIQGAKSKVEKQDKQMIEDLHKVIDALLEAIKV